MFVVDDDSVDCVGELTFRMIICFDMKVAVFIAVVEIMVIVCIVGVETKVYVFLLAFLLFVMLL